MRLQNPEGQKAYSSMFRVFVAFALFMSWDIHQVTVLQLLCFLECLQYNGVKVSQMANYLSAIKTKFVILGLDVVSFADPRLKYYQRAMQLHSPLQVKLKKVIDVSLLHRIVQQCNYTYMGQVFKAVYLVSFYSFLRLEVMLFFTLLKWSFC